MQHTEFMASPATLGIDEDKLAILLERARKEVDEGLLPSAQVAIARHGKLAAFETFGDADNNALFCFFSSTKAITAAAGWLLIQDGQLDITRRVAEIIPEFAENGKQDITIEQLFTHTAGFPHAPFRPTDWLDKDRRMERFSSWTLNWSPGSRFEYHPTSSMWVIAELIERLTKQDFREFIRQRIALPLELPDLYVGCPAEQHHRVQPVTHVGEAMTAADYEALGMPVPPETEVTEEALTNFNKPEAREVGVPGGGGITSAADMALFYQGLIGETRGGSQPWRNDTLTNALSVRTGELPDLMTGVPVNRALGVVVSGDDKRSFRGFGHANSPRAFGHGGAGGQVAWLDQETGISFAWCTGGHDRNAIRQARRSVSLSNRAAVCAME